MYTRNQLDILFNRLHEPKKFIQVLYGPRQTGKTTIINQLTDKLKIPYHYVSADGVHEGTSWIEQQWAIARLTIKQNTKHTGVLIIDEIQKIHNWSEIVKKEWDADKRFKIDLKVVLLGSSRVLIQKGLTESLMGRFETIYVGHWSYNEMHKAFGLSIDEYIWHGGYPGAADLIHNPKRWKQYIHDSIIETSITKDILLLDRIDKPTLLKNLFELGCNYSGQILSYTKILGQLQDAGNTTTLSHYLQLLSTAGLLSGIDKFSFDVIRQRASSPRFQVNNMALMSGSAHKQFDQVKLDPELWGRWVESAIGAHLLNYTMLEDLKLYYWRDRNIEVDFIVEYQNKTIALEVKSGKYSVNKGLEIFAKQYKPHKVFYIGSGGISIQSFLKMNPIDLF